ncbi:MAG: NUDIX domain-containing protein, partial [Planctomycetota bacterium]
MLILAGDPLKSAPNAFLLMRHAKRWDLPKGHSDPGETLIQTALRETQEETGIALNPDALEPD